ncbi:hypothetical protein [Streptomyces beijiangensis]|uniref:HEAT repeat domain-containing protein n=1 Tax=Streptomyces beijiangensis TaxID=163361 RepID=A0A939FEN3_9ACTN|nr:hypothetical protein [Streptomyces beijiangensis]MBO0516593.1 hypothetical protein [Streptomyces beijiangensis]
MEATGLGDAGSPSWSVRAAAGRRLATSAERPEATGTLLRLLLDAYDSGVTQNTARALLDRGDTTGLRLVLGALARATETSTADQLSAELDCDPRWTTDAGSEQLIGQLEELACDDDTGVRSEAQTVLRSLRPLDD